MSVSWTGCELESETSVSCVLIKAFLKAGVVSEDGIGRGTRSPALPKAAFLSPLLSNVALFGP